MSPAPVRRPAAKGKIKKGICQNHSYLNPDTGETGDCPKCASGEIQSVNVQRLSDFKCAQCGSRLTPASSPINVKKILMIAIPVLAIACAVPFFMTSKDATKSEETIAKPAIGVAPIAVADTVGNTVSLVATVIPETAPVRWASSDDNVAAVDNNGTVTLLKKGEATITAAINDSLKASSTVTVIGRESQREGKSGGKTVLGGAATISGNTIMFHRDYTINLNTFDDDMLYVSRGDRIKEAKIENGYLRSGIYVSSTGEERYISGLNTKL